MQGRDRHFRVGWKDDAERLDETRFLESQECTALLHRFQSFCGDSDRDLLAEFGDEKRLCLEIYLSAARAGRVEFSRADTVGIPAADLRFLTGYAANSRHSPRIVRHFSIIANGNGKD